MIGKNNRGRNNLIGLREWLTTTNNECVGNFISGKNKVNRRKEFGHTSFFHFADVEPTRSGVFTRFLPTLSFGIVCRSSGSAAKQKNCIFVEMANKEKLTMNVRRWRDSICRFLMNCNVNAGRRSGGLSSVSVFLNNCRSHPVRHILETCNWIFDQKWIQNQQKICLSLRRESAWCRWEICRPSQQQQRRVLNKI